MSNKAWDLISYQQSVDANESKFDFLPEEMKSILLRLKRVIMKNIEEAGSNNTKALDLLLEDINKALEKV